MKMKFTNSCIFTIWMLLATIAVPEHAMAYFEIEPWDQEYLNYDELPDGSDPRLKFYFISDTEIGCTDDSYPWVDSMYGGDVEDPIKVPSTVLYRGVDYKVIEVTVRRLYCDITVELESPIQAFRGMDRYTNMWPMQVIFHDGLEFLDGISGIGITDIYLPNTIMEMCEYSLSYCDKLESVNMPDMLRSLPDGCFSHLPALKQFDFGNLEKIGSGIGTGCLSLIELDIPESVTSIGRDSFADCLKLQYISIPSGILTLDGAFVGCPSLRVVTVRGEEPCELLNGCFEGIDSANCTLVVPPGCVDVYRASDWGRVFSNITDDASGVWVVDIETAPVREVYTVDGMKIETDNAGSLPAGLYVIDGRKVLVK